LKINLSLLGDVSREDIASCLSTNDVLPYKLDLAGEIPIMGGFIFFSRGIRTIAKFKR
jgi:hypothetical protein